MVFQWAGLRWFRLAFWIFILSFLYAGHAGAAQPGDRLTPVPMVEILPSTAKSELGGLGSIFGAIVEDQIRGSAEIESVIVSTATENSVVLDIRASDFEGQQLMASAVDRDGETIRALTSDKAVVTDGKARLTITLSGAAAVSSAFLLIDSSELPFGFRFAHDWRRTPPSAPSAGDAIATSSDGAAGLVRARLTPVSDGRTSAAIQAASAPAPNPALQRMPGIRLTNQRGYIDIEIDTRGKPTFETCRAACTATDRCRTFVIEEANSAKRNRNGGYCGLVLSQPTQRYDKAWMEASNGYSSYRMPGTAAPTMMQMRSIGLVVMGNLLTSQSSKRIKTVPLNSGRVTRVFDCGEACVLEPQCQHFIYYRRTRQCELIADFQRTNSSSTPSNYTSYSHMTDEDFVGAATSYDSLGRIKSWRKDAQDNGVGLFNTISKNMIESKFGLFNAEDRRRFDQLSAAVAPSSGGLRPYFGDAPPVSTTVPAGQADAIEIDVAGLIAGAGPDDRYAPFYTSIWRDRRQPGTYYYAPKAYYFAWDKTDKRLGGSQFYRPSADTDGGAVRFQLTLSAEFDAADVEAFEKLAKAVVADRDLPAIMAFRPLPFSGAPRVNLNAALSGVLGTDAGNVTASVPQQSVSAPITLSFNTTEPRAESMIEAMAGDSRQSFGGSLSLSSPKIAGDLQLPVLLDARLPETFGSEKIVNKAWTNASPFAALPQRVRALMVYPDRSEILSWSVADATIAPGGRLTFAADANFPEKIWQSAARIWLDFDLDTRCQACLEGVFGLGGLSSAVRNKAFFRLTPALRRAVQLDEVEVHYRSRHLTAEGERLRYGEPIYLTDDPSERAGETGEFYLKDGLAFGDATPIYAFKAYLRYRDDTGTDRLECTTWIESSDQTIRFEMAQFTENEDACRL